MAKKVIFCADGTWNGPDKDDNADHQPDPTNVYKFFLGLEGKMSDDSIRMADEQEKELIENDELLQVAKYIHGVGDSRNPIQKLMGGAFGAGTISRIVRGYTFISRNYEEGDDIVILGFSRGAYTARALAGLIASQGLLSKELTKNKEKAYKFGAQAWYKYRSEKAERVGFLQKLAEAVSYLPGFLSRNELGKNALIPVKEIKAVGVWDTVGAMGIPHYEKDERVDAFKFTDTVLNPVVKNGFHAVSLDEQRGDFTPTLWDEADNVTQVLFPGAHADVGGGYTTNDGQSGLSDIALSWIFDQMKTVNVRIKSEYSFNFNPDVKGTAHQPWRKPPFNFGAINLRNFKGTGIKEHPSIEKRMGAGDVFHDPDDKNPGPYKPQNRPISQ